MSAVISSSANNIPLVYGETLSPTVFSNFLIKREQWFCDFTKRISQYFALYDERNRSRRSQITGIAGDIEEFRSKVVNTSHVITFFKIHFSKLNNYDRYYYHSQIHIESIRHYLTTVVNGVRFHKRLMHELDPEVFNSLMYLLRLECISATVEQSAVSFKL